MFSLIQKIIKMLKLIYILIVFCPLFSIESDNGNILTIIGTTNVHGEIDPCGWKKKPLGGLARKATVIKNLKAEGINPLILDAGDLLFKKNILDPGVTLDVAKVNAEIIIDSFNEMGCDAFSVGSKDFAGGLDFILDQYKKSNFPFLSANIVNKSGQLIFEPYTILKSNNINIGVIGLTSVFDNNEIQILDPIASLKNILKEVNKKSDVVILLFNATQQDLTKLYNNDLELDMILSSRGRTRSSDGGAQIPTYIAGDRGKILYKFELNFVDKTLPFTDLAWCENTINRVGDRLQKMKQGNPDADLIKLYKNDQKTLNRIYGYQSQLNQANQSLENAINTLSFEKIELGKLIFDSPSILKIVDKGKEKILEIGGPMMDSQGRLPGDPHHGHNH